MTSESRLLNLLRKYEEPESKICEYCGGAFIPNHPLQKYCNLSCRRKANDRYYPPSRKYTPEQLQWLKDRSQENMAQFYLEFLNKVDNRKQVPRTILKILKKHRLVFRMEKNVWGKDSGFRLTPRGKELLKLNGGERQVEKI